MGSTVERLQQRWDALVSTCGLSPQSAAPHFAELVAAYGEVSRAYHTLAHLAHVFAELDAVPLDDRAVQWAVWYHDFVYDVNRKDNESSSARLAARTLSSLGLASDILTRTEELILATARHQCDPEDQTQALFLDADLAILGADPEAYAAYVQAIRRENYRYSETEFGQTRRGFLQEMLVSENIYKSEHFQSRYERQARVNMQMELAALSVPVLEKA